MKKLRLILITLLILSIFTGCNGSNLTNNQAYNARDNVEENEFLLFKADSNDDYLGDLYLQKSTNESEKLSSDVQLYSYYLLPVSESTVFLDGDASLYLIESGKEKELITTDASMDYRILSDESGILFLKSDERELYFKLWGQEKEKISSEVNLYDISEDGKRISFSTNDNNLYIKDQGMEREKIASNVANFYMSYDGNTIYYMSNDNALYFRDIENPDNIKLTTGDIFDIKVAPGGEMITYLNEYNYEKGKGELYFINNNQEPKKIASDVTSYQVCNDGKLIYYLNEENALLSVVVNDNEKIKLTEGIEYFQVSGSEDKVIAENTEGSIYLIPLKGEKVKIGDDIHKWSLLGDSVLYLTNSSELYLYENGKEKVKLSIDIENYSTSEYDNSIAYYTKDNQLFLKPTDGEAMNILSNVREYNYITYSAEELFTKRLILDDIRGIWSNVYEGEDILLEITNEDKIKGYYPDGEILEANVKLEDTYSSNGNLYIYDLNYSLEESDVWYVGYIDENQMNLDGLIFARIDRTELDSKLEQQRIALEEEKRAYEEAMAKQKKIDDAYVLADDILSTYQIVSVNEANFRETPSVNGNILGTISLGAEFYIRDTYVDEDARVWCNVGAYDESDYYVTGWTSSSNFK